MKQTLLTFHLRMTVLACFMSLMMVTPQISARNLWCLTLATPPDSIRPRDEISFRSNQFGFRLYQESVSMKPGENQFFSPLSIFVALTMTAEGANGKTLAIMRKVLNLPDALTVHWGMQDLATTFRQKEVAKYISVANAIWTDKELTLRKDFLQTMITVYLGGCYSQDFAHGSAQARNAINNWVSRQTRQHIQTLLPPEAINSATKAIITNAIYFKAHWQFPFDKNRTKSENFFLTDKKPVLVPMMHSGHSPDVYSYCETDLYQSVLLPYENEAFGMMVILPRKGKMQEVEAELHNGLWEITRNKMRAQLVNVSLPRFKMALGGSLKPVLSQMGMASLFQSADFSRMFQQAVAVQGIDLFHETFVEVNEVGTEASGLTVRLEDAVEEMPEQIFDFRADRPFLFMIQHQPTASVLFLGKLSDPSL